jgi:hypothetical protein
MKDSSRTGRLSFCLLQEFKSDKYLVLFPGLFLYSASLSYNSVPPSLLKFFHSVL